MAASSYVETATRTFPLDGSTAIAKHLRVTLSSGNLALAGIADKELGTMEYEVFSGNEEGTVRLRNSPGTKLMVASAAITAGAAVFTAASGKVGNSAATAFLIGTALTAAAADGDIIEVLPNVHGDTAAV